MTEEPRVADKAALLAAYEEICRSYHAIDEFRMKLLGLLPLASLVAVFLVDKNGVLGGTQPGEAQRDLIGFAAIFAAMLTLALFGYELRGIQRCHNLIEEGVHVEELLGIGHGQFHVCAEEHADPTRVTRVLNAKLGACVIYSLVFSGWLFMGLRFGAGLHTGTCAASAAVLGALAAFVAYRGVAKMTAP
jgi:hypothetical protein